MKSVLVFLAIFAQIQCKHDEAVQHLKSSIIQLGGKLFKTLETGTDNNLFLSNLAMWESAAVLYNGARGQSAKQIATGYGFQGVQCTNEAFEVLIPIMRDEINGASYATIARNYYVSNNYQINDDFKKVSEDIYKSGVYNIDFQDTDEATSIVDQAIAEGTNDIIQDVLLSNSIESNFKLISVSGVYKQGKWDVPFDPSLTTTQDFYVDSNKQVPVEMMTIQSAEFNYYESKELKTKFLELPFHNGQASLILQLPTEVDGIEALVAQVEKTVNVPLKKTRVKVSIPKFQIKSRWDIKNIAQVLLKVEDVFDDKADLSGVAGKPGELIENLVIQECYLRVNEGGLLVPPPGKDECTEDGGEEPQVEFIADHPFLFHIKRLDLITSAGRVSNPSAPIDEKELLTLPTGVSPA